MFSYFFSNTLNIVSQRVSSTWPWYVIRGSGFVAAGLLVLIILTGIGKVTGIAYRFFEPLKVQALHKAMAIALLFSIAIHGSFLLIDHFLPFSLTQILVPYVSHYNNGTKLLGLPFGSLGVTFGILAMYGILIIIISSLFWVDSKKKIWRWLHYLSYVVVYFILLHALYVGTDLKYGYFRLSWIGLIVIISLGVLARLWRTGVVKPNSSKT